MPGTSGVELEHAPVGFGSHHWVATAASGARRFVTVDEVGDARFERLAQALLAARTLHDAAGLGWVVGPVPCDRRCVAQAGRSGLRRRRVSVRRCAAVPGLARAPRS
jgi:hypothetical protein